MQKLYKKDENVCKQKFYKKLLNKNWWKRKCLSKENQIKNCKKKISSEFFLTILTLNEIDFRLHLAKLLISKTIKIKI